MVNVLNLREGHRGGGDLLAPVASQLSGDPSSIDRRCMFGWSDFFIRPDGMRDDLAPVAVSEKLNVVVVIVLLAEMSVAVLLGRQGR
jgi:hypothetical protein